ncbi:MAG TPA: aminoacyl-tRNA hydrolase [Candidatus Saccharimonadales bacterium]|nr:aminoacyl-tRNA hydrolase [Candidatus Saccharimonadales bacterium]
MKLIVGLGNIGQRYAGTRHNLGFMVIDRLVGSHALPACSLNAKFKAQIVEGDIDGEKVLLVKPTTMMNLSGQSIGALTNFYKLPLDDLWVIYDDVDLEFGKLRIRRGGSSGGHNGLNSIIGVIGADFVRFRLGIASDARPPQTDTADFVLSNFAKAEVEQLPSLLEQAGQILTKQLGSPIADTTYNLTGS